MFFTIRNEYDFSEVLVKYKTLNNARKKILLYPMKATEIRLDEYCRENYKANLKTICIKLLFSCKIMKSTNKEFTILFKNKQDDYLASLITYGNSEVNGSNILRFALSNY